MNPQLVAAMRGMANVFGAVTGIDVIPKRHSPRIHWVLGRMSSVCGPIGTVIDVGSSDGRWCNIARKYWPDANYLLVEAQPVHKAALVRYRKKHPKTFLEFSAASNQDGEIHFNVSSPLGGSASHAAFHVDDVVVPCVTLDRAVSSRSLPGPYFLKLDTHGHEREILNGASNVIAQVNLIMIEAYNFASSRQMPFWELCAEMEKLGFRPAGLADPLIRDDGMLWQMDLCFIPSTNERFARKKWES